MDVYICENYEKCPIFSSVLDGTDITAKVYKQEFCKAGPTGWNKCKRYLVKKKSGKCPQHLLPNAFPSADEIIAKLY